jgi:hypothetical protein
MRRGLGWLGLLVTIVIVAVVGVVAYQAGWSDGFAQHAPATGAVGPGYPYYYGYGPHFFGFGWIFGLLFFLFFFWVIFRVIGFAIWGGRMRGWGGTGGWHQYRDERMREWHDRAHSGESGSQSPPPPPPPPTTA